MRDRQYPNRKAVPAPTSGAGAAGIARDDRGAVIIEAAFVLPLLVGLLYGVVTYACWFMAAHSLQQAANDAARAAVAGIDSGDRANIVAQNISQSVLNAGTVQADLVTYSTSQIGNFYSVSVSYQVARSPLFRAGLVPVPQQAITRTAVVQLMSL